MDTAPDGVLWLLHPSGQVLVKETANQAAAADAQSPAPDFLLRVPASTSGFITAPLAPGGQLYLTAYRSSLKPESTMAVSVPAGFALKDWYNEALIGGLSPSLAQA